MRIGIVNDGALAAEAIRRAIVQSGKHDVAWMACDGAEAVARCQQDRPDLVLMDLFMPHMDGVEATRQIMARTPCAIIVVTAEIETHAGKVFEAMGAGALDAVDLPVFGQPRIRSVPATPESPALRGQPEPEAGAKPLLDKIETIRRLLGAPRKPVAAVPPASPPPDRLGTYKFSPRASGAPGFTCLVAIGASAGGPAALATILGALPAHFPAAVVIVQHMDKRFAPGLTEWFGTWTKLPVRVAQDGERPEPGAIFLAGRDQHLILSSPQRLGYTVQPRNVSYCPSVDVFFESVAHQWPGPVVGVLLTGMGRDGATGLQTLRQAGHHTIAQDESTSAVYGMPRAAVALEAAQEILALDKIGPRLTNMFRPK